MVENAELAETLEVDGHNEPVQEVTSSQEGAMRPHNASSDVVVIGLGTFSLLVGRLFRRGRRTGWSDRHGAPCAVRPVEAPRRGSGAGLKNRMALKVMPITSA
ncbi:MAG TPA: hypothetical protein VGX25_06305 [Actinophytocola sp.]|uniref:hypothetical protein n=1 Tax=Actinophytocola sp. TaxID=1872138 RepID=UPI002DDD93A8|nr:hypothetical protein [Actinophytocola sp.]HEV2778998.1 hypothetical protein [Actinophytocola sp.]